MMAGRVLSSAADWYRLCDGSEPPARQGQPGRHMMMTSLFGLCAPRRRRVTAASSVVLMRCIFMGGSATAPSLRGRPGSRDWTSPAATQGEGGEGSLNCTPTCLDRPKLRPCFCCRPAKWPRPVQGGQGREGTPSCPGRPFVWQSKTLRWEPRPSGQVLEWPSELWAQNRPGQTTRLQEARAEITRDQQRGGRPTPSLVLGRPLLWRVPQEGPAVGGPLRMALPWGPPQEGPARGSL